MNARYHASQELRSQRISELFANLLPSACQVFFRKQQARRLETEHLAYDTTSISSYSQLMKHVKFLLAAKTQVRWIQECIEAAQARLQHFSAYDPAQQMYCTSTTETWREEASTTGEEIRRRIYVHVYYSGTRTPKRGWKIKEKQEAIEAHLKTLGYMVLLSNSVKDPRQALSMYRQKDVVEKAFGNLKNRLNMKRAYVSSSESSLSTSLL